MKIGDFDLDTMRTLIIAELSANHAQSLEIAKRSIQAAKQSGADAIKLQTYTPDTLTLNCDKDDFIIRSGTKWDHQTLYALYQKAYTPWEWHEELFKTAKDEGLICFSTPFDPSAVDFLETFNPPAYKVASFEITDYPLIRYIASKKKPIIISTGIATLEEMEDIIHLCKQENNPNIILLQCTSAYPAPLESANLLSIADLSRRFGVTVGFSDHTLGITAPIVAVTLGAKIIEKHFILDKTLGGPDAHFSLDAEAFATMVHAIRESEKLLGETSYHENIHAIKGREFARSLYVTKDIQKGELFTHENIRSIRPAYGLHPKYLHDIIGKQAKEDLKFGMPLKEEYIQKTPRKAHVTNPL